MEVKRESRRILYPSILHFDRLLKGLNTCLKRHIASFEGFFALLRLIELLLELEDADLAGWWGVGRGKT